MRSALSLSLLSFLFLCCTNEIVIQDSLKLNSKLSGHWQTAAFDGELHESWDLQADGWMQQQGYYIEKGDTSYSAKTKIEQIGEEVILISVIKNSNPKIFKAVELTDQSILFENKDYKNPFQVHYEFLSDTQYRRTIKGYERDSLVSYVFDFEKVAP